MADFEIRDLRASVEGKEILKGVTLAINKGEVHAVMGPNGSGKSTLFDCVTGLQRADAGTVHLDGIDITGWPMHRIAHEGTMLRSFQKTVVFATMTPEENLIAAGQMFDFPSLLSTFSAGPASRRRIARLRERASHLIEMVGLSHVRDQDAGKLSFGQQKLLQFACCLMPEPQLILLDEPLAGVNPVLIGRIVESIRDANSELGITFVVIEHNIDVMMSLCQRVVVLDQGAVLDQGDPETIMRSQKVVEAYLGG